MPSDVLHRYNVAVAARLLAEDPGTMEVFYRTHDGGEHLAASALLPTEVAAEIHLATVADHQLPDCERRLLRRLEAGITYDPPELPGPDEEPERSSSPVIRDFNTWSARRILSGQYTMPLCRFFTVEGGGTLRDMRRILGRDWLNATIVRVPPEDIADLETRLQAIMTHEEEHEPTQPPPPGARANRRCPYTWNDA